MSTMMTTRSGPISAAAFLTHPGESSRALRAYCRIPNTLPPQARLVGVLSLAASDVCCNLPRDGSARLLGQTTGN